MIETVYRKSVAVTYGRTPEVDIQHTDTFQIYLYESTRVCTVQYSTYHDIGGVWQQDMELIQYE